MNISSTIPARKSPQSSFTAEAKPDSEPALDPVDGVLLGAVAGAGVAALSVMGATLGLAAARQLNS